MQNQLPIKYIAIAVLALVLILWLWPSSEDEPVVESEPTEGQRLVSSIQPINDADALTLPEQLPEVSTSAPLIEADPRDQQEFDQALAALRNNDFATADSILEQLIQRQPGLLEPYINLASSQAARGDLAMARKTLDSGLRANENYAALYQNLKKVHAALAADAYRTALAETSNNNQANGTAKLELPMVSNLNASVSPTDPRELEQARQQIAKLEADLQSQQALLAQRQQELDGANSRLAQQTASVSSLTNQLQTAENTVSENSAASQAYNQQIFDLESKLASAQTQIADLQNSHQAELSELNQQLARQQAEMDQQSRLAAQEQAKLNSQIAALTANQNAQSQTATVAASTSQTSAVPSGTATREDEESLAIERVKSWAQAWSDQDVADYVEHYQDDYTPPGSSISHSEWRAQRQVRLTNKRFIEVTLSGFETERRGDQIRVTFTQRYRANTMDDTIRKELALVRQGSDWSEAKIVSERVVR